MSESDSVHWTPPEVAVYGGGRFPVRHVWCVGRNYAEHAREMGAASGTESPIFFSKPAQSIVNLEEIPFPPETESLHHEVELVAFLAGGGRDLGASEIPEIIYGYAVGVDLTRRDVQARLKAAGHPWEVAKGFDASAPVGEILSAQQWRPEPDRYIELSVNGEPRQSGRLGEMIWPVEELLARLSRTFTLNPGDVVFTGTPAGVGPLHPGERVEARIEGLSRLEFTVSASSRIMINPG